MDKSQIENLKVGDHVIFIRYENGKTKVWSDPVEITQIIQRGLAKHGKVFVNGLIALGPRYQESFLIIEDEDKYRLATE